MEDSEPEKCVSTRSIFRFLLARPIGHTHTHTQKEKKEKTGPKNERAHPIERNN